MKALILSAVSISLASGGLSLATKYTADHSRHCDVTMTMKSEMTMRIVFMTGAFAIRSAPLFRGTQGGRCCRSDRSWQLNPCQTRTHSTPSD